MKLSIVIPVYNEEENLPLLLESLDKALAGAHDVQPEYVFVDDGSRDGTLAYLRKRAKDDSRLRVVSLSRNFGSHAALMAGFQQSSGEAVAYLAADLQDPPEFVLQMLEKWRNGVKVVWGTREQRDDPVFTKLFSILYSSLIRRLALSEMPTSGVDVCLVDRQVIDAVLVMQEKNTSVFGLIMWSGFSQVFMPYQRQARRHGKSRWTLAKRLKLFVDSFVSFSFFPIRLVSYLGIMVSGAGFVYGLIVILRSLLYDIRGGGWPSLMVMIVTLSGLQLLMLGIVAEYLWRTFDETRRRPPYIIKEIINPKK